MPTARNGRLEVEKAFEEGRMYDFAFDPAAYCLILSHALFRASG